MPRLPHGLEITPQTARAARGDTARRVADVPLGFAALKPVDLRRFDYLFLGLQQDDDNLLPESRRTRDALKDLGLAMADDGNDDPAGDSGISAAYTYFGQFVDHDITLEAGSAPGSRLTSGDLKPLSLNRARGETLNVRTGVLELDSLYGLPAEKDPEDSWKMKVGPVDDLGDRPVPFSRPAGNATRNDLPREKRNVDVAHDRAALIGDPRNDENTIISQLHVALLHAHNRLAEETDPPNRFRKAKKRLRRHYQHIVLHDFLKQIADPRIVDDTIGNGNRVYDPPADDFFMPLEFSVAAFRFGHSMVRSRYDFNVNFNSAGSPAGPATLELLFTFTALSGQLGEEIGAPPPDSDTLPENWIIEWENFFDPRGGEPNSKARAIDTQLVEPLQHLRIVTGQEEGGLAASLAARNLLRGYLLRMPTGHAVARELGRTFGDSREIPVLTGQQIRDAAANQGQTDALEAGGFWARTPLWYYILAEAKALEEGRRLGPVGSTLVAEVLVGLIRRSPDSILDPRIDWKPNLPRPDEDAFTLADLLRFARVLEA